MKKGLVALAVLGAFSGAALAQSSVTLYGIADVAFRWAEVPTSVGTAAAPRIEQKSYTSIDSGHQSGSRWGLRGSENLGGGLTAIFTLENGFNIDTGAAGDATRTMFNRQAYVGLASSSWGGLVAGRLATFSSGTGDFDMMGRLDPFGTGFILAGLGNTFYSMNALRVDNAVAYQSPVWSGFRFGVGYSTNIAGAEQAISGNNNDGFISALNWSSGPFWVGLSYDAVNNTGDRPDQKHFQIGGTFDIGALRLHAGYADQSNIGAIPTVQGGSGAFLQIPAGLQFDNSAWMLGATYTMGPWKFMGSFQMADADSKRVGTVNYEPDYNVWGVGATYNFSRRTNVYASYASRDADGTLSSNTFNAKQFALGMRHLF